MMEKKSFITEKNIGIIIAIVFLLGTFLRFYQLGENPLDNHEADYALQAIGNAASSENDAVQTDPLLVLGTKMLFFLFGERNFAVRFLPALMGSLLILAPLFLRKVMSPIALLVMSIGLALEPSLMAMSRVADSHILSVGFFVFFVTGMALKKEVWIGIFAGLLLLSGPGIGFLLLAMLVWFGWDFLSGKTFFHSISTHLAGLNWKIVWMSGLVTFLTMGTLFLQQPEALSASLQGIAQFFQGWIQPNSTLKFAQIGIVLIAYELCVLVFGVWGMVVLSKGSGPCLKALVRWIIIAFVIAAVYPSRSAGDLIWITLPLWIFAALNIERLVLSIKELDWIHAGGFGFLMALFGFVLMNWVSIFNFEFDQQQILLRWVLVAGSVVLILLITFMLNYGWGKKHGTTSLLMVLAGYLVVFSLIPAMWNAGFHGNRPDLEFWRFSASPGRIENLKETIDDLSEWNHGRVGSLQLVSSGVDEAAVRWILRDYPVEYVSSVAPGSSPEAILTTVDESGGWSASYTGQDFIIQQYPNWSLMIPSEWQQWLIHRNSPVTKELVIFWVRTDLFPGGSLNDGLDTN